MYDIKNMNIWEKESPGKNKSEGEALNTDLADLNLSVRSYNCLRRAGCNTLGDVIRIVDEGEESLRKIRNLGSRSQAEILEAVRHHREMMQSRANAGSGSSAHSAPVVKPAKRTMDREITEFGLSRTALEHLHACGVRKVGNLYRSTLPAEPGWYAVRELFEKVPRRSE